MSADRSAASSRERFSLFIVSILNSHMQYFMDVTRTLYCMLLERNMGSTKWLKVTDNTLYRFACLYLPTV